MLLAVHGHRPSLRETGADAIGALVALIPQRAQGKSGVPEFALQGGVGDGAQYRSLGVGQNDRKAGAGDLLVQTFHLGARDGQQFTQALLQLLHGLGIEDVALTGRRRLDAVLPQTPIPRSGHQRLDADGLKSALDHVNDVRRVARQQPFLFQALPLAPRT